MTYTAAIWDKLEDEEKAIILDGNRDSARPPGRPSDSEITLEIETETAMTTVVMVHSTSS
jgi:hypothetical protein